MDKREEFENEEYDIARLLRAAGPREEMPTALKRRWEVRFRDELLSAHKAQSSRRRRWAGLVAAAVLACAVAIPLLTGQPQPAIPSIRVSVVSGASEVRLPTGSVVSITEGLDIETGSVLQTGPGGRVRLAYAGYDLRVDETSEVVFEETGLRLRAGGIYVSDDERRIGSVELVVVTHYGSVRDIGTQFAVSVDAGHLAATVRRGKIVIDTGTTEVYAESAGADTGAATRVTVDEQGQVITDRVAATGRGWAWIFDVSGEFRLEGRSAYDFLRWSVSESGRRLEFASADAELHARRNTLHGSVRGAAGQLDPEQVVDLVLGATDLIAKRRDDTLLVLLARDADL